MNTQRVNIFWFRRDLRLEDNRGLHQALQAGLPVLPVFIFDTHILDKLADKKDRRVSFIHQWLGSLDETLRRWNASLEVAHGKPLEVYQRLCEAYEVDTVFCNEDYEPYARERDTAVADFLKKRGIGFKAFKDSAIMAPGEVLKGDGTPYSVFSAYAKRWLSLCDAQHLGSCENQPFFDRFYQTTSPFALPSLADLGFQDCGETFPLPEREDLDIDHYDQTRDRPDLETTTRLGPHLRFGTVSPRRLARWGGKRNQTWLNQLIWRDFFKQILYYYPRVVSGPFRDKYGMIPWRNNPDEFKAWCEGRTGYPMVDAGMRQLNQTGYMHNRVRMVTASFLCKHLLINWRWGEAYFAARLLDFDLAANNGNWQWAAGTGCDAAPYFRVFSPARQEAKFDPDGEYVRRWVEELDLPSYPAPMVDHGGARNRALRTYQEGLALFEARASSVTEHGKR